MTEEQLAQLGIDAEVLLNTEAFNRTINILVDASVQEFLGTASAEGLQPLQSTGRYRQHFEAAS